MGRVTPAGSRERLLQQTVGAMADVVHLDEFETARLVGATITALHQNGGPGPLAGPELGEATRITNETMAMLLLSQLRVNVELRRVIGETLEARYRIDGHRREATERVIHNGVEGPPRAVRLDFKFPLDISAEEERLRRLGHLGRVQGGAGRAAAGMAPVG